MSDRSPSSASLSPRAGRREWLGLAVLVLPTLLLALDMTVLHLAAPRLSADLEPTSAELLWILDIYGFMVAGFLITMGTLGDRIGRRRLLLIGACAFGLASIAAAFANSAAMLIATRALLGIAGATLMPSTLALIRNLFHVEHERTLAITIWMTGFIVGSAIGPLVGGIMLAWFWWGSVFLLAVPVMLLLLLVGPWLLPESRDPNAGKLDLPSALLCISAVLLLIFAIKDGARDGINLLAGLSFIAALLTGTLFVRRQRRLADPMFDLTLFRKPSFSVSVAAMLLCILALSGSWLMTFQFLQGVNGLSALQAGLVMLPSALLQTVASLLVPRLSRWLAPAWLISAGLLLTSVGLGLMLLIQADSSLLLMVAATILLGVGIMPMMILGTDLVIGSAPPEKTGAAAATSETATELGMAMGIAVIGSVGATLYRSQMEQQLRGVLDSHQLAVASDTIGGAMGVVAQLPPGQLEKVRAAINSSFTLALHANALIGVVIMLSAALLVALCLRRVRGAGAH